MSAETVAFTGALVHANPELLPLLGEHLDELDGEILPHVYVANVEKWVETEFLNGRSMAAVQRIVEFMERSLNSGRDDIDELIVVSFLEHLPTDLEAGSEIRELLGPGLAELLGHARP